jgi:cell division protein FtsL
VTPPASAAAPAVRRPPRPTAPARRVSGPVRAPVSPKRPARPQTRPPRARTRRPAQAQSGLVPGLLAAVGRLERHRLLHRLIAGRAWIGLVAFALIGIVTLQLALLELNSNVGRALEREATLQRENAALAIDNSELAAGNRVESLASRLGMQLVPMSALRFLTARPRVFTRRAAAALSAPAKASVPAAEAGAQPSVSAATQAGSLEAQPAGTATAGASPEQSSAQSASASQAQSQASAPAASAQTSAGEASGVSSAAQGAAGQTAVPQSSSPSSSEPAGAAGESGQATPGGGTQAGATG